MKIKELFSKKQCRGSGFGSPTKGQTTQGQTTLGQTTKGKKRDKRVKRQSVKKCDKGAIFFLILTSVTVSIYLLLLRVRLGKTLSGPSAAARTG